MADLTEHRRTQSSVTGGYYCIYDGEDWPCSAITEATESGATDDSAPLPLGAE